MIRSTPRDWNRRWKMPYQKMIWSSFSHKLIPMRQNLSIWKSPPAGWHFLLFSHTNMHFLMNRIISQLSLIERTPRTTGRCGTANVEMPNIDCPRAAFDAFSILILTWIENEIKTQRHIPSFSSLYWLYFLFWWLCSMLSLKKKNNWFVDQMIENKAFARSKDALSLVPRF